MTLVKEVIKKYGVLFEKKKSHTSRAKRVPEKAEGEHIVVS